MEQRMTESMCDIALGRNAFMCHLPVTAVHSLCRQNNAREVSRSVRLDNPAPPAPHTCGAAARYLRPPARRPNRNTRVFRAANAAIVGYERLPRRVNSRRVFGTAILRNSFEDKCLPFSPSAVPSIDRPIIGSARQDGPLWPFKVGPGNELSQHKQGN